jgi:signal transduction histidine kinase
MTSAQRMEHLIADLLEFSRLSRQPLSKQPVPLRRIVDEVLAELRREPVRLAEVVEQIRQTVQADAGDRNISWTVADLPYVLGDEALLRQVFANLLSNAVKYTRHQPEARIEIAATPAADHQVVIHVRDNGAGFDMKYADKLFGVFQRLHADEDFEGTGVGLATVRRIVQRHGGRVWAEAKVQAGATFFVALPAAAVPVAPAPAQIS